MNNPLIDPSLPLLAATLLPPPALAAALEGSGALNKLFILLLYALAGLVLWGFGRWAGVKFGAPAFALTVWDFLFALVGVVLLINFLLGLAGKSWF